MKIVAVSRVLNEEDIVEPFIRHHESLVDHHIVLDNGSIDRTLEILMSLKAEGARITVLQNNSLIFSETQFNTSLYEMAVTNYAADWVIYLDADEFIDTRQIGELRPFLAAVPREHPSLGVALINYNSPSEATQDDINVVKKFVRRVKVPADVWKVFVRGSVAARRVTVDAGNHNIFLDGVHQPPFKQGLLRLAHYPNRSPLHWAGKAVTGWLKVLAAGQPELKQNRSEHYVSTFQHLQQEPGVWVQTHLKITRMLQHSTELVDDPITYLGKPLLYTETVDYGWRALSFFLEHAERLATAYGTILDGNDAVRKRVEAGTRDFCVIVGPDPVKAPPAGHGGFVTTSWKTTLHSGFKALLGSGWSTPEEWGGVWGIGELHELRLIFLMVPAVGAEIEAEVDAPLVGTRFAQYVDVSVKDFKLAVWKFTRENNLGRRTVRIPAPLIAMSMPVVCLQFRPHSVTAPAALAPGNKDTRLLGMCLRGIRQRVLAS